MNRALDEVASTSCSDKSIKNLLCGNNLIFVVIIFAVLLCGCGGNSFLCGVNNPCVRSTSGCNTSGGGFQNNLWIWILLALLLFGGNGLGGTGAGNINTNVINVDPDDNYGYDELC
ncbi:hypothetical protein IAI10_20995 [Clostridium sp. 19966]|uniref:hypothetical protein n=1 Tax=Clostridium sp. 19966 TaxID=2768166 RepID=UPI0028DDA4D1|nr:hypothetical protein [Clostridium sp. 19966]MDT8719131.1 hypothetical protein [Clostridium sp. 19966]